MTFKFNIIASILACANAGLIGEPGATPTYSPAPVNTAFAAPTPARSSAPVISAYIAQAPVIAAYTAPTVSHSLGSTYSNYATPAAYPSQALGRGASPVAYSTPAVAPAPIPAYGAVTQLFYSVPAQVSYSAPTVGAYGNAPAVPPFSVPGPYSTSINPC